jgi:molybdenum cofactor cytidylyltransferase
MGTPKALLPWKESTLLEYAVDQARTAEADDVIVVLGHTTEHVAVDARIVVNPDPDSGRSASIRLAAAAIDTEPTAIIVQSVDQPVTADILSLLFDSLTGPTEIVIPTCQGRRGHPICLAGRLLSELRCVTEEDLGLRAVVQRHAAHILEVRVDSESVVWNLNDPAAYTAARATR